jgi:hypothetical protein
MGDARRRRAARGVTDERTSQEVDAARLEELRRIERHRTGTALVQRRRGIGIDTPFAEVRARVERGDV